MSLLEAFKAGTDVAHRGASVQISTMVIGVLGPNMGHAVGCGCK